MKKLRNIKYIKMSESSPSLSIIPLSINDLDSAVRRQTLAEWMKTMIQIYAIYKRFTLDPKKQTG